MRTDSDAKKDSGTRLVLRRGVALLSLALVLCSCNSRVSRFLDGGEPLGNNFSLEAANGVQDGLTTQTQVRARLGEPETVTRSGSGETWHYRFQRVRAGRTKTWGAGTIHATRTKTFTTVLYSKTLYVIFDTDGVVTSHSLTESGRP